MRHEEGEEDERKHGVDIHGNLEGGELQAGEDCEEAVEARQFVEEHGESDHLDAGTERQEV